MLCPTCGSEYRDGFVRCADCDVDLVSYLPPAPSGDERSQIQLVEVFETGDPAEMSVLESLLQDAGIDFTTSSETAKDYYAGGRFGGSFGFGPMKFFVRSEDEAAARDVIASLSDEAPPSEEEEITTSEESRTPSVKAAMRSSAISCGAAPIDCRRR